MTGTVYMYGSRDSGGDAGRLRQHQQICDREARRRGKQKICEMMGSEEDEDGRIYVGQ